MRAGIFSWAGGRPVRPGKYRVLTTVTDSARPARESLSEWYTIIIGR